VAKAVKAWQRSWRARIVKTTYAAVRELTSDQAAGRDQKPGLRLSPPGLAERMERMWHAVEAPA
jgi:hypothetical protein